MLGVIPLRGLLLLTGGVLAGHVLLLQNMPLDVTPASRLGTRIFTTRTLVPVAPPSAARNPAPATDTAAATPAPRPRAPLVAPPVRIELPSAKPPIQAPPAEPIAAVAPSTEPASTPEAPASAAAQPAPAPTILAAADPAASAALQPSAVASAPPAPEPARPASSEVLSVAAGSGGTPATPAQTYVVPGSVRLKFNATGMRRNMQYQALGELLWQHDGQHYEARLELGALFIGTRVITSTGAIRADGLVPERFADRFRNEVATHFDRVQQRIVFSNNRPQAALDPGAQDQLSVFMQLAATIAGAPERHGPGTVIAFQTAGPRSAEIWRFSIEAAEKLYTPGGSLQALKLTRRAVKEYDPTVELWLAPDLSYLPARIRITQANGDFIDQQWRATEKP